MNEAPPPDSGKLHFIHNGSDEAVDVYWEIIYGDFDHRVWKAAISFSWDYSLPPRAGKLLFNALLDDSVETEIEPADGKRYPCWITNVDDLADESTVDIASPMPALHERVKLSYRYK